MRSIRSVPCLWVTTAVVIVLMHSAAFADPIKCRRTIVKENGKFVAAMSKSIDKCKNGVITKGQPPTLADCDPSAPALAAKTSQLTQKLAQKIASACGGADHDCSTAGDNDLLASIGWNVGSCMNFESGGCNGPINNCNDVTDCLTCIGTAAVEQGVDDLLYDQFNSAQFTTDNAENKCQVAVAKAGVKFLQTKTKILNKCWDAKLKGKAGFAGGTPCPDTDPREGSGHPPASPGDNKTVEAIKKAEQKKIASICRACGGGGDADKNGVCDTLPGFPLASIVTTPFICPDWTVPSNAVHPGGLDCGDIPVTDVQSYIQCIDCMLEFKADCMTDAGVGDTDPALGIDYPLECSGPPLGGCPTKYSFTADGPASDLDYGWTGISHDLLPTTNARFTATISGCTDAAPLCGTCTLSGPISNGGGAPLNNHRCRGDSNGDNGSWIQCASNAACPGADNACTFFFGPPRPTAAGGVGACSTTEMTGGALDGTIDLGTGAVSLTVPMTTKIYTGILLADPCPRCVAGTCSGGERNGEACTINGSSSLFGDDTSLDCPPNGGGLIGTIVKTAVPLTTGTQTRTLSAASPSCTAFGFTSLKCMCDTCDNAARTPCTSNADCIAVGAAICGGPRCLGEGGNAGTPCATDGECTSGSCGVPGEPTSPNSCSNGNCVANTPPDNDSVDEGQCEIGPSNNVCSVETFRSCSIDNDCRPPAEGGSCPSCAAGMQTCMSVRRQCFTANGAIGDDVVAAGVASTTAPTLAGSFCGSESGSSAVNAVLGLPGLVRYTLPGTATIN